MSKQPPPKPDDPEQYKRFVETAKEVEADDDPEVLEKALGKISAVRSPKPDDYTKDKAEIISAQHRSWGGQPS